MGYAVWRCRRGARGEPVHVGLAAAPQDGGPVLVASPDGAALVSRYVEKVRLLAGRGACVVVLPEATIVVDEHRLADQLSPLARAAGDLGVDIVVGAISRGDASANVAVVFGAGDQQQCIYRKQHLLPRLEADYRPGHDLRFTPDGPRLSRWRVWRDVVERQSATHSAESLPRPTPRTERPWTWRSR